MSVAQQAKAARRKAKIDPRYTRLRAIALHNKSQGRKGDKK